MEDCGCHGAGIKPKYKPVTHVIFDLDGLMLDTEPIYERLFAEIAHSYGKEYTTEIRLKVMGTPEYDSSKIAVEEMGLPITPEEFLSTYKAMCVTALENPDMLPGVQRLVEHLHKHQVPIAIATSSHENVVEIKTRSYRELFSLFHHVVCGSSDPEVKHGKPAPDIYLICASRFSDKPSPDKVLVFEDAPNGVTGAKAAGMQVVMVPPSDVSQELRKNATMVLSTMEAFKPENFGLPPYD